MRADRPVSLPDGFHLFLSIVTVAMLGILSGGLIKANLIAVVLAGVGLATVITMASSSLLASDDQRSQATERTLRDRPGLSFADSAGVSAYLFSRAMHAAAA